MENYNKYKVATEKADWRAICEINGVSFDALGTYSADKCSVKGVYKKDQLRK